MDSVMYAQCDAQCDGLSYEHLRNLRFLGLRRDENELSVPVDEVLSANRLQLCDDAEGPVREPWVPAEQVERELCGPRSHYAPRSSAAS